VFDHMENRSLKECLHGNCEPDTFRANSSENLLLRSVAWALMFLGRSSQDAAGLADKAAGRH
jgi:hypothetical protein